MPENEWWFDLNKYTFTIEYKQEKKKIFLVVREKPRQDEKDKAEST
jgi:hypothetical protein